MGTVSATATPTGGDPPPPLPPSLAVSFGSGTYSATEGGRGHGDSAAIAGGDPSVEHSDRSGLESKFLFKLVGENKYH